MKKFVEPELEILTIVVEDVVTVSWVPGEDETERG